MTGMMIYYDALEEYQDLNDEQFGRLLRAGLLFAKDGTETELNPPEKYLYRGLILKIKRDKEKYQATCEKRAEAARKRWNSLPGENAEEPEGMQMHANACKQCQKKEKEKEQYQYQQQHQQQYQEQVRAELIRDGYTETEIDGVLSRLDGATIYNLQAYLKKAIDEKRREKVFVKRAAAQDYEQRDYSGEQKAIEEQQALEVMEYLAREREERGE